MAFKSPLPRTQKPSSIHPLLRMRSESQLAAATERTLPRLRSMGQLSSPPDWPLPPIPPRSPLRPKRRTSGLPTSGNRSVDKHSQFYPSDSSSSSGLRYSQDGDWEPHLGSYRNTTLTQDAPDQPSTSSTLHPTPRQTPTLSDLSRVLHLRGRLQEMGCTFTPAGALLTYGNPPLRSDLEQMLRLGAWYDEQWNLFFDGTAPAHEAHCALWPDLALLKRMLQNEGVVFDAQHRRCADGDADPKLVRLGDYYDGLRDEWRSKMMRDSHSKQRSAVQDGAATPTNLGWAFVYGGGEDDEERRRIRSSTRSSRLTMVVEEQIGSAPDSVVRDGVDTAVRTHAHGSTTTDSCGVTDEMGDEERGCAERQLGEGVLGGSAETNEETMKTKKETKGITSNSNKHPKPTKPKSLRRFLRTIFNLKKARKTH
ncbi:hypothetical protein EJ07DRAFT_152203 [Lizonia empirigonia]|nr:hypothetical protein EJ07DRAFT_152203 [Lizonia empirigonia]